MASSIDDLIDSELLDLYHQKVAAEHEDAAANFAMWAAKMDQAKAKLKWIKEKMATLRSNNTPAAAPTLTPKGRVKKGLSKPLILEFVKASNGLGVSMKEIISGTGTKYGTIRRVLQDSPDVEQTLNARWRWKRNNLSTQSNGTAATATGEAPPLFDSR